MDLVAAAADANVSLSLFLTGTGSEAPIEHGKLPNRTFARRITTSDLVRAIDGYNEESKQARSRTVCYVCGPPDMTDGLVAYIKQLPGMVEERVLCEKWW